MLDWLVFYARSKHTAINPAKSEVVHFNAKRGAQVVFLFFFTLAEAASKCSEVNYSTGHWQLAGCLTPLATGSWQPTQS